MPGPRTSIVRGNSVRETSAERLNKTVQEITRNVSNVFSFYAIIRSNMVFQCINICQVPREVLKTPASDIGGKAKQNSARNNAKCIKCFQFLCNNKIKHGFSMH